MQTTDSGETNANRRFLRIPKETRDEIYGTGRNRETGETRMGGQEDGEQRDGVYGMV
jgi:hypothetical protein